MRHGSRKITEKMLGSEGRGRRGKKSHNHGTPSKKETVQEVLDRRKWPSSPISYHDLMGVK